MLEKGWDRLGGASGLAAFVTGAAGGTLERGWPSANDPTAIATFVAEHRAAILGQSMLFVLSAGICLWFFGSLRSRLARAEGGTGRVSTVMFGAGTAWAALSMLAQSFQVGVAMAPSSSLPPPLLWTAAAAFGIANLPLAIMLVAFAAVSLRNGAFPKSLGWLSLVTAGAELTLWIGTIVDSGPLAPNGWLTYVLYPAFAVWLIPTSVLMMKGVGAAPSPEQDSNVRASARDMVADH